LIGVELRAEPEADVLDAVVPVTVSRREAASSRGSRTPLAGADGDLPGVAAVAAVAAAAREEDTVADGRAVARAAGAEVRRPGFGVPAWEVFELWAAPVAVEPPASAHADPAPEPRATPIPSATANPPTRPMHVDAVMFLLYGTAGPHTAVSARRKT
jgi:hypothetical protein